MALSLPEVKGVIAPHQLDTIAITKVFLYMDAVHPGAALDDGTAEFLIKHLHHYEKWCRTYYHNRNGVE